MLPVLPFLIGGALGAVAGVVLKTYYEERDDEINDLLSNINKYIAKDTKLVSSTKVNNELKEDEIICQVLIAEDKK